MPNWCSNVMEIRHEDAAQIERVVKAANEERLFEEFVPRPNYSDKEWEVVSNNWNTYKQWVDIWGTKWDAQAVNIDRQSENELRLSLDTAWNPPIPWCARMEEQGFGLRLMYCESGDGFAGIYENGALQHYDRVDFEDPVTIKETLPADLADYICREESYMFGLGDDE